MLGLEPFAVAGLLTLSADLVHCNMDKAPTIQVQPSSDPVYYDFSKTSEDLKNFHIDTISPYGPQVETIPGGLTNDKLTISFRTSVTGTTYPTLKLFCMWYDTITVQIHLSPVVYVAKNHHPRTCQHKEILEHEKKHVRADREIANKYARQVGVELQKAVNRIGALGPYPESDKEEMQKKMMEHIKSVIVSQELSMQEDQRRMQEAIDSLEEYERVRKACE